mmetsp:Transcript_31959/g.75739  ORF Transcript_31959/g.75739 Transcript_31959/m.75739 type:complete len:212 (-) Transcript_31959:28-663(-)
MEEDGTETLVFDSDADAGSDEVRAHFRKFETRPKDGETEADRAEMLLQGLDAELRAKASNLRAKGIKADPKRLKQLFGAEDASARSTKQQQEEEEKQQRRKRKQNPTDALFVDEDDPEREPSPTAWRHDGDRRYPVYPGYELPQMTGRDKLNQLQALINQEGDAYDLVSADDNEERPPTVRPWPPSAVNDPNPEGFRWVDRAFASEPSSSM